MFIEYEVKLRMRIEENKKPEEVLDEMLILPLDQLAGYHVDSITEGKAMSYKDTKQDWKKV